MTNHYLPTRADTLQVGDVVRLPAWFNSDQVVDEIETLDRGFVLLRFESLWAELTIEAGDLLDKRLTAEEYERLEPPF